MSHGIVARVEKALEGVPVGRFITIELESERELLDLLDVTGERGWVLSSTSIPGIVRVGNADFSGSTQ